MYNVPTMIQYAKQLSNDKNLIQHQQIFWQ